MKRLTAILMGVCVLISCQGVVRAADSTTGSDSQSVISTTVPDEHKVEIVGDHAYVVFGEETEEDEEGIEREADEEKIYPVKRFSEPQFQICAEDGWKVTKVLLNGSDVTDQVKEGVITLPSVYEDQILTLETEEIKSDDEEPGIEKPKPGTTGTDQKGSGQKGTTSKDQKKGFDKVKEVLSAKTGDMEQPLRYVLVLLFGSGLIGIILMRRKISRRK